MQQALPWIIALVSVAVLAMPVLLWARRSNRRTAQRPLPTDWALSARPVFSTDERLFYHRLREALPHHIVLSKLPLLRFCQPTDPQRVRYWFGLLGNIHVAFAVCSANGRVLAAVDIETDRAVLLRTAQIKQSVLNACRVRYLRCAADPLPSIAELQRLVPPGGGPVRGRQPAAKVQQMRDQLGGTIAARRGERATLWRESGYVQDSFFNVEGRADGGTGSEFGALRAPLPLHEPAPSDAAVAARDDDTDGGPPTLPMRP